MATRTVTGLILRSNGDPWAGGVVRFKLLDDTYTVAPDETFPIYEIVAVADDAGLISVTLVSGLDKAYRVRLPDNETFDIVVPNGAPTTLETLRAAFSGNPIPATIVIGPTGPAGPVGPTGATGSGTVIVQEGDVTVDAAATTLDFTPATAWAVTSSPAGEANIAPTFGTAANTFSQGNHTHTPAISTNSNTVAVGASAGGSVTATCDAGEVVIGGGCEFDGGSRAGCEVHVSAPVSTNQWTCVGTNNATPRNFLAHARCITVPIPS